MYSRLWVFSLWIRVVLIEEELVGSRDKLWAICFLPFFHGVHGVLWVAGCLLSGMFGGLSFSWFVQYEGAGS
jgi:hypothetical protein